jgi:hypothetical protein
MDIQSTATFSVISFSGNATLLLTYCDLANQPKSLGLSAKGPVGRVVT